MGDWKDLLGAAAEDLADGMRSLARAFRRAAVAVEAMVPETVEANDSAILPIGGAGPCHQCQRTA